MGGQDGLVGPNIISCRSQSAVEASGLYTVRGALTLSTCPASAEMLVVFMDEGRDEACLFWREHTVNLSTGRRCSTPVKQQPCCQWITYL